MIAATSRSIVRLVAMLGTALFVGGCCLAAPQGGAGPTAAASVRPSPVPDASVIASFETNHPSSPASNHASSPGVIGLPPSIVDPVVAEIARVAGVPVERVTIVTAEPVTFPDAGLGCPLPGVGYPQVQVDGYRIVAEVDGRTYDYRGTGPGSFRRCLNAPG